MVVDDREPCGLDAWVPSLTEARFGLGRARLTTQPWPQSLHDLAVARLGSVPSGFVVRPARDGIGRVLLLGHCIWFIVGVEVADAVA
jgi:hypothetical protein